jgi:hypothetical protein
VGLARKELTKMGFVLESVSNPSYLYSSEACASGAEFIFSTRLNGISPKPFDSMNMAFTTNDSVENIQRNRNLFFQKIKVETDKTVYMQQTHGVNIQIAEKNDAGRGAEEYRTGFPDTDGIITNDPEIVVCGCFADCVPVWLFDPIRKVGGIIHAGWKGTAQSIVKHGIRRMSECFGSVARDIMCAVGPSIGPCCFKVDKLTAHEILISLPLKQHRQVVTKNEREDLCLDLWQINSLQLQDVGVLAQHIVIAGQCTCCLENYYHSFRRDKEMSGRMSAIFRIVR